MRDMIEKVPRPIKYAVGVILVLIGVLALVTPLTPGAWIAIIGLELLGLRVIFFEKLQALAQRYKRYIPIRFHSLLSIK